MHTESHTEMARLVDTYLSPDEALRVLDLGSCDVNGTYRPLFSKENWSYDAAGMQPGPNVDHILPDPYRWTLENETYDVIVFGRALEQIKFFWHTWKETVRVLKPGGLIFLIIPARATEQRHPVGCWSFYRDGFRALGELEDLEVLEVESRGTNPPGDTVGVFRKPARRRPEKPGESAKPERFRFGGSAPSSKVRDPKYAAPYGMSVADWMIYHHENIVFDKVSWMGVKALKNPMDCWIYQEILWEVKPDVLVEIGSFAGGSTLYFCHLFDLLGQGTVVSLDVDRTYFAIQHPRLVEITADCADPGVRDRVASLCRGKKTMILHDADHEKEAVLRDLRLYADLVPPGSYFIVEDGVVDVFDPRATSRLGWDRPGPLAAVREFLKEDDHFVIDESRERYLFTYNPCGFLKRVN